MNFPFLPVETNPLTCTCCPKFTGGLGGRAGRMLYIVSSYLHSESNTAMPDGETKHTARFLWELWGTQKTVCLKRDQRYRHIYTVKTVALTEC